MRTRTTTATLLLAAALLLTGCSSDNEPDAKPDTKTSTTEPADTPEPAEPLTLGKTWEWESEDENGPLTGSTTALAYRQPITGITPPDVDGKTGEVWGQVEAKLCVDTGQVMVSQFPWSIAFADGARVEVTGSTGGDLPRPEYPMDVTVKAGDCVRGLIMFPVPEGQRPERIIYAPDSENGPAEWAVPAIGAGRSVGAVLGGLAGWPVALS
jgi:hypothetical protein